LKFYRIINNQTNREVNSNKNKKRIPHGFLATDQNKIFQLLTTTLNLMKKPIFMTIKLNLELKPLLISVTKPLIFIKKRKV